MDGRRDDVKGVPGRGEKPERATLGSIVRKLEWGSARAGTQHMHTVRGKILDTG